MKYTNHATLNKRFIPKVSKSLKNGSKYPNYMISLYPPFFSNRVPPFKKKKYRSLH